MSQACWHEFDGAATFVGKKSEVQARLVDATVPTLDNVLQPAANRG